MRGAALAESVLADVHDGHDWESLRERLAWATWKGGTAAICVDWDPNAGSPISNQTALVEETPDEPGEYEISGDDPVFDGDTVETLLTQVNLWDVRKKAVAGFSGGMRQRLQIARNLVTQPRLVFMDEPTSGLDVSVQARLLDLLRQLTRQMQLAVVIVTHDLAVARLLAHRMMVMQRGRVVEAGLTDQVLDDPQHPYTQLLVSSVLQP